MEIKRWKDVSMPKMVVSVDGNRYCIKRGESIKIKVEDGEHTISVLCGGYSATTKVITPIAQSISVKSIIPNWYYYVVCPIIIALLILYLLGRINGLIFNIPLLLSCCYFLFISICYRKRYFKISVNQ